MAMNLNRRQKRALTAVAIALPVLAAMVAVPAFLGRANDPITGVDDVVHQPSAALAATPGVRAEPEPDAANETMAGRDAAASASVAATPSVDGSLEVQFALRTGSMRAGSPLTARISLDNMTLADFYVPAAGEPQPTLVISVLDSEGVEVRRVVETSADKLPRRLLLLESGASLDLQVRIVAMDEEGLPAGTYRARASYGSHPSWKLVGLRCFEQGKSPERSEWVEFELKQ